MSPYKPSHHTADRARTHAVQAHKRRLRFASGDAAADLGSLFFSEPGIAGPRALGYPVRVEAATAPLACRESPADARVHHVVSLSAEYEVSGITAQRRVALMPNDHAGRDGSLDKHVSELMSAVVVTAVFEQAVPSTRVVRLRPQPTPIRAGATVQFAPEGSQCAFPHRLSVADPRAVTTRSIAAEAMALRHCVAAERAEWSRLYLHVEPPMFDVPRRGRATNTRLATIISKSAVLSMRICFNGWQELGAALPREGQ
jgi:hypothetical protein